MKKTVAIYGALMAFLIFFLKFFEYRFLVRELSAEFYVGTVALLFTLLGIWVGSRLNASFREKHSIPARSPEEVSSRLEKLSISQREMDVLRLMAAGYSNQEIADQLFLSVNTIKSHSSNLFLKLDVKRRTQAILRAKSLGILE